MLIKEFVSVSRKAFVKHLWIISNFLAQEDDYMFNVGEIYVELNLVQMLMEAKEMIGEEMWMDNYDEYTGVYCLIFSNLTWNYENYYGGEK